MSTVFQIEDIVDELFEEVCPPVGLKLRALKPLLAPVLGELMPDHNVRELLTNREYYRVDFADFADYATSTLTPEPVLGDYPDGQAWIYEGIDRRPEECLFTTTWSGRKFGISILDAIVARYRVFTSVTTRLLVYRNPLSTYRQQYGELDPDDVAGATALTTMIFAAQPIPGNKKFDIHEYERQPLEEWDRYYIMPPVPGDLEWRFALSGTYTDYFLDDCLRHPKRPGGLTADQIEKIKAGRHENETSHAVEFELGRLALALPSYIRFMYDLVVNEKAPISRRRRPFKKHDEVQVGGGQKGVKYRIIKSVRVYRPGSDTGQETHSRSWTPPSHPFAVRGHWRVFNDPNRTGHDESGRPVRGRTWVREYEKSKKTPYPFPTSTQSRPSSVIINIKQSLSYGRDLIQSQAAGSKRIDSNRHVSKRSSKTAGKTKSGPSAEWRAQERSKLTSGLRYFILRRDNFRCQICGRSAADESGIKLEVDHRVPVDEWGRTEEANLWTLCRLCNRGKGIVPI